MYNATSIPNNNNARSLKSNSSYYSLNSRSSNNFHSAASTSHKNTISNGPKSSTSSSRKHSINSLSSHHSASRLSNVHNTSTSSKKTMSHASSSRNSSKSRLQSARNRVNSWLRGTSQKQMPVAKVSATGLNPLRARIENRNNALIKPYVIPVANVSAAELAPLKAGIEKDFKAALYYARKNLNYLKLLSTEAKTAQNARVLTTYVQDLEKYTRWVSTQMEKWTSSDLWRGRVSHEKLPIWPLSPVKIHTLLSNKPHFWTNPKRGKTAISPNLQKKFNLQIERTRAIKRRM